MSCKAQHSGSVKRLELLEQPADIGCNDSLACVRCAKLRQRYRESGCYLEGLQRVEPLESVVGCASLPPQVQWEVALPRLPGAVLPPPEAAISQEVALPPLLAAFPPAVAVLQRGKDVCHDAQAVAPCTQDFVPEPELRMGRMGSKDRGTVRSAYLGSKPRM